jgi:hypothetical protein
VGCVLQDLFLFTVEEIPACIRNLQAKADAKEAADQGAVPRDGCRAVRTANGVCTACRPACGWGTALPLRGNEAADVVQRQRCVQSTTAMR